jgi:hypothetical protein
LAQGVRTPVLLLLLLFHLSFSFSLSLFFLQIRLRLALSVEVRLRVGVRRLLCAGRVDILVVYPRATSVEALFTGRGATPFRLRRVATGPVGLGALLLDATAHRVARFLVVVAGNEALQIVWLSARRSSRRFAVVRRRMRMPRPPGRRYRLAIVKQRCWSIVVALHIGALDNPASVASSGGLHLLRWIVVL